MGEDYLYSPGWQACHAVFPSCSSHESGLVLVWSLERASLVARGPIPSGTGFGNSAEILPPARVGSIAALLLLLLLILHRRGLCLAQLEQAVPPRCFTCNASSPVLRLHSASAV
ncbi:hypothetical protein N658DRAFT_290626 [Parathielavia hyrcaniae]|uniref:Uncharacterized protein n=1 Tax=Parathielavia hyrcaniae TaxID=113614 RepID=A0AAN6SXF6_9PEZI|nr:hypothetical protein N658DRAFT_290626 [Parathielavia hyrcaniae]